MRIPTKEEIEQADRILKVIDAALEAGGGADQDMVCVALLLHAANRMTVLKAIALGLDVTVTIDDELEIIIPTMGAIFEAIDKVLFRKAGRGG